MKRALAVAACLLLVLAVAVWRVRDSGKERNPAAPVVEHATGPEATAPAAVPFSVRGGLPNAARKFAAGGEVVIAFLGGSITENRAGFSTQVPAWLQQRYPQAAIRTVNAGWAGTGSALGAQRIDREVLVHRPALVFVEFAVNDMAAPRIEPMERIVRRIWTADPKTDIAFLYSIDRSDLPLYAKGRFPPSTVVHEQVARHYHIPGIAMGFEIARRVHAGEQAWDDFFADVCHPSAGGYARYTEAICGALEQLFAVGEERSRPLPPPLTAGFVLYPAPTPAEPLAASREMQDARGLPVQRVFPLPLPGRHWVGGPEFREEEETRWRMYWQPLFHPRELDSSAGLERTRWQSSVEWLEEAGFFLGPSGRWLAGGRGPRAGDLGANATEQAVVAFVAPLAGEYAVEWGADRIAGYQMVEKRVALNVVHFPRGAPLGRSIDFHASSRAAMKPFTRRAALRMEPGDELAFVFLVKEIGAGARFQGLHARIGWMGEAQ